MKFYDKRFVRFEWTDELIGKKCFIGNSITDLLRNVEVGNPSNLFEIEKTPDHDRPFQRAGIQFRKYYRFAYYDPNYEVKVDYLQGNVIQCKKDNRGWFAIQRSEGCQEPDWEHWEFRLRPEEAKPVPAHLNPVELMYAFEEIFARVENIRIYVGDGDKDAVIAETRAIEAVLGKFAKNHNPQRVHVKTGGKWS